MTEPMPFLAAAGLTVQRPDGTLERVEFADGASWNADTHAVIDRIAAADDTATSDAIKADAILRRASQRSASADLTAATDTTSGPSATSREAVVESNARQTIADLATGAVGTRTLNDIADAVARARTDSAAGRAINRGMERE